MIGYVLSQEQSIMPEFYTSWQELIENLEALAEIEIPNKTITIEPCIYYESDFKEKRNE